MPECASKHGQDRNTEALLKEVSDRSDPTFNQVVPIYFYKKFMVGIWPNRNIPWLG